MKEIPDKTKMPTYTLNALRGFAAIFVIFSHVIGDGKYLDPQYLPNSFVYFNDNNKAGHLSVLIFFVISGAVISLSNKDNLRLNTISTYIKKRAIRLYPIYAFSLIFALVVSTTIYSVATIGGNFVFMQVLFSNVILANGPIWTLHYEIIFYLLFIPISMLNIDPVKVAITAFLIGIVNYIFLYPYTHIAIITSYCFGFTFWSFGLIIVKYFTNKNTSALNNAKLVSFIFLIITFPYLNQIEKGIYKYSVRFTGHTIDFPYDGNINNWFKIAFPFADFAYLPLCFLAVILFSGRSFKYINIVLWLLQLVPAYSLFRIYKNAENIDLIKMIFPITCYFISCSLLVFNIPSIEKVSENIIKNLTWLGGISYGIYIIHGPLIVLFSRITFFSGSGISFMVRLILYFSFTILSAYFLEKIFQTWVISSLSQKKILAFKGFIKSHSSLILIYVSNKYNTFKVLFKKADNERH